MEKRTKKRTKKVRILWGNVIAALVLVLLLCAGAVWCVRQIQSIDVPFWEPEKPNLVYVDPYEGLTAEEQYGMFLFRHSLSSADFPAGMKELFLSNEDARSYVMDYPYRKDAAFSIDLSDCLKDGTVPLLMQWDERWGYQEYAGNLFGLSGCGPTNLSMAAIYLKQDTSLTPETMRQFAIDNGYATDGNGSLWSLISEGGQMLGLQVWELGLSEEEMKQELNDGHLIIAIMGEGVFTTSGHFILFTGVDEEGKFIVNDCNSLTRSNRHWAYDEFSDQVLNLWTLSA